MSRIAIVAVVLALLLLAAAVALGPGRGPDPAVAPAAPPGELSALRAETEALRRRVEALGAPAPASAGPEARIAALERRVAALATSVDDLTAKVAAGPNGPPEDLSALDASELMTKAAAASDRRDYAAAVRYLKEYLDRSPGDHDRGVALNALGWAYRMLGETDRELETFEAAVRYLGEETAEGASAQFRVGWAHAMKGEYRIARDLMDRVAATEKADRNTRKWARYWSADYAARAGDPDTARRTLDAIVAEYADALAPNDRLLLQYARKRREELDAR